MGFDERLWKSLKKFNIKHFECGSAWKIADREIDYDLRGDAIDDLDKVEELGKHLRQIHPKKEIWCNNTGESALFWIGSKSEIKERLKTYMNTSLQEGRKFAVFTTELQERLKAPDSKKLDRVDVRNGTYRADKIPGLRWDYSFYFTPKMSKLARSCFETSDYGCSVGSIIFYKDWDTYDCLWKNGGHYLIEDESTLMVLKADVDRYHRKLKEYLRRLGVAGLVWGETECLYLHLPSREGKQTSVRVRLCDMRPKWMKFRSKYAGTNKLLPPEKWDGLLSADYLAAPAEVTEWLRHPGDGYFQHEHWGLLDKRAFWVGDEDV